MNKIKLAIITINYNGLADTIDLLESLKKAKKEPYLNVQVYVIDNGSSDDSIDVLSRRFPEIRLIQSPTNLGFSAGNNLGIKVALKEKADWIMLINNDTLIDKSLFKNIYKSPLQDKKVGVLGGLIYFAKGFEFKKKYKKEDLGKVIWFAGGKLDWNNIYGSHYLVDKVDNEDSKEAYSTDFITGAFLLTRFDVLKKTGIFDEDYFMYLEDVDLCYRIQKKGFKTLLDPSLKIWHKVAQSSGIGSSLNDYFLTRNRLLFGLKYATFRTKFALIREAVKKLFIGSVAQKTAIKDFFTGNLGKGSWIKN
jgi:GT2 family glycosyltransferase